MGLDVHSAAVIGLRIPLDVLKETYVKKHSEHEVPEGAKFCPECGAEAEISAQRPVPFYDGGWEGECISGEEDGARWEYKLLIPQASFYDPEIGAFVICDYVETTSNRSGGVNGAYTGGGVYTGAGAGRAIAALCDLTFERHMKSIGLWDPDQFGLWAINNSNW